MLTLPAAILPKSCYTNPAVHDAWDERVAPGGPSGLSRLQVSTRLDRVYMARTLMASRSDKGEHMKSGAGPTPQNR